MAATNLPTRSFTNETDDAIPDDDSSETTKLFFERLQAWKHACGYIEDYITATEKLQNHQQKEYEKVLKSVNSPLREGHHFDQQNGGIAQMFESLRTNTQGIANSHGETAKTLKGTVLPIFERLHAEIKSKQKELDKTAGKGAKAVDKARQTSQKHIEALGSQTAGFASIGGNIKAGDDPYVLQRQIYHRLNKQIIEENNNRDEMISVQNNFATFEAHVIQVFQQGVAQFNMVVSQQCESTKLMYGDIVATTQAIPPDFEWNGFIQRNNSTLIDPNGPKRSITGIRFPNQDHPSTQPLIAGSLERKGKMLKRYDTGYYVVTPSKYMHEFKTDDDFAKDPTPENSLYLPDCLIGAVSENKFVIKGKDSSKGALGNKLSMSHEYAFKAHTVADAHKWHDIIATVAGQISAEVPDASGPSTPVGEASPVLPQTTGIIPTQATTDSAAHAAGGAEGVATTDKAVAR